jgi:hypothetical protein
VLVSENNSKIFALNYEIIILLSSQAQAVVLAMTKGEADGAAIGIYLIA